MKKKQTNPQKHYFLRCLFAWSFSWGQKWRFWFMWPPMGAQVSEVSKAWPFWSVGSSGPLHSVRILFERWGRYSRFHFQSRKASVSTGSHQLSKAWIISPPLFFLFFFRSLCKKTPNIWASLTLGVFRQESRRWYPYVKTWHNLGSEKCAQACEDVLNAICVMLLMWPLTVQPCDSPS